MKKQIIFLCAALMCCIQAAAENYPYRSDYLWVAVPDHHDWLYQAGEDAKIELQFYKYGIPRDAEVEYQIADDMLEADKKGSLTLKNGRAVLNIGSRKTPGFRDLSLKAKVDGKSYSHHIKVGFSVDEIQPAVKEPADFLDFWNKSIEEMRKVPMKYTKELSEEYSTDRVTCYLVKLYVNKSQAVYAYLFYPKDAKQGGCPAVLCPPGAGIKTIKEPLRHKYYAENGCVRMEMEIHGLDPRLPEETFKEISNAFNGRENGYLLNGLSDRDRYYMKRVYLSLIRAIDFLTSLPEWDGKNVIVQGGSQGGALSIVAAGIDSRVTQCVANHPALSDMAAYDEGKTGGYPHFNRVEGVYTPENIKTMQYYDVVNFARHVKADTYMTWGFNDNTCPPTTSYTVWNTLTCPKESLITPINEHWTSEATERGHLDWILKHLK